MNYLFVGNSCGSQFVFRGPLIRRLLTKGHRVVVLANEDEYTTDLLNLGVIYKPINLSRYPKYREILDSRRLLKEVIVESKIDQIFSWSHYPNLLVLFSTRKQQILKTYTVTGLGGAYNSNRLRHLLLRKFLKLVYIIIEKSSNTRIFFQNQSDELELFNRIENKHKVLPGSGFDLYSGIVRPIAHKAKLNELSIVLIAKCLPEKRVELFYNVAREFRKIYPKTKFVHYGALDPSSGRDLNYMLELAKNSGVNYKGRTKNLEKELQNYDIVISTSMREGLPRSILESLANDLYVVGVDAPGVRDTVINDSCGCIVPPDVESVIKGIISYDLKKKPGASYRSVQKNFNINMVYEEYFVEV